MNTPEFKTHGELFTWLRANKHLIMTAKKSAIKFADPVMYAPTVARKDKAEKSSPMEELNELGALPVKVVINTTNIMDSHSDVHMPGIWKKSLSENKRIYHIQEHQMKFDHIISDQVAAATAVMTWKELGFDFAGNTEALIFDSIIEKERNEYMAEQYAKGYVKNHSVGMIYVKMELCMNSEAKWDTEEKAAWDKYITQVVNRPEAEEQGYFWAITEAKVIEGSAVPMGSNYATPTLNVGKDIALDQEPPQDTPKVEPLFGLKFLTN